MAEESCIITCLYNSNQCANFNHPPQSPPTPEHGDHEIYSFGNPFLGHHYFILNASARCPRVEKKIRNVAF